MFLFRDRIVLLRACLLGLTLIGLAGCATHTYGTSAVADNDALSHIHVGVSTTADLRRLLGEPAEVQSEDAGIEVWTYRYVEYQGTYVPLFGAVAAGERQESVVRFRIQDGQVERIEQVHTQHSNGL